MVNLTHELGLDYEKDNIQVNAICPGFFFSRLADGAYDDPSFVQAGVRINTDGASRGGGGHPGCRGVPRLRRLELT